MNEYDIALASLDSQSLNEPIFSNQVQSKEPSVIDGDTLLTQYGSTRIAGIDAPESYESDKSRNITDRYGITMAQQASLGLKAKDKLDELKGTHVLTNVGSDIYGRALGENADLAQEMINQGVAVPYNRYDQKLQDVYRANAEKKREMYGITEESQILDAQRDYNLDREKPSLKRMLGQTVDALQAGTVRTVLDTADAVMDLGKFWGDGNSAFLDEAKKQENIDKWVGYDRREAEFRLNETLHDFKQGNYLDGVVNMLPVAPQLAAESLPMMLGMVFGAGKFTALGKAVAGAKTAAEASAIQKAATLGEKLSYKLADNAGFAAVYSGQLNDRLEERQANQGGADLSPAEVMGVAAEEFLMLGLDRMAFGKVIGLDEGKKALDKIAKLVPEEGKIGILKKLGEVSGRIIQSVGTEAGQEFIQEFGNSLGSELGTKKFGDEIITDARVKQSQIAAIAGGAAGGHMRTTTEAINASKEYAKDTIAGEVLLGTIDTVREMSDIKRKGDKSDELIKDRDKVINEYSNVMFDKAVSDKVGVKNQDGTLDIGSTLDNAVYRVNAIMGTEKNEYVAKKVVGDILANSFKNIKDEESLNKFKEVANSVKEKYGSVVDMNQFASKKVDEALEQIIKEVRSETEGSKAEVDVGIKNMFADVNTEDKPSDTFKNISDRSASVVKAMSNLLNSFPIDDDEKRAHIEKLNAGIELIKKYKDQGGKNIDDVSEELANIGFVNQRGNIVRKSIKDHEADISNAVLTGKEPSSAVKALESFVNSRYTKGISSGRMYEGKPEAKNTQSFVNKVIAENNSITNMLNDIRKLTDATKYKAEYVSKIDEMITRLDNSNKIVEASGKNFIESHKMASDLGLEIKQKQEVKPTAVAPSGATESKVNKVNKPKSKIEITVAQTPSGKSKYIDGFRQDGSTHKIFEDGKVNKLELRKFINAVKPVSLNVSLYVGESKPKNNQALYVYRRGVYKNVNNNLALIANIIDKKLVLGKDQNTIDKHFLKDITDTERAWLININNDIAFKTKDYSITEEVGSKVKEPTKAIKVEAPIIQEESIIDEIQPEQLQSVIDKVKEDIDIEVSRIDAEVLVLKEQIKKISNAINKHDTVSNESMTEAQKSLMEQAKMKIESLKNQVVALNDEKKIHLNEATMGMKLWHNISEIGKKAFKPLRKNPDELNVFDVALRPITSPNTDVNTMIKILTTIPALKSKSKSKEYMIARSQSIINARTQISGIVSQIMSKVSLGNMPELEINKLGEVKPINGDFINPLALISIDGKLTANQKEIIAYAGLTAITESIKIVGKVDNELAASIFGVSQSDESIPELVEFIQSGKVPKIVVQKKIGKFILDNMGLSVVGSIDKDMQSKIESALGLLAIDAAREQGILTLENSSVMIGGFEKSQIVISVANKIDSKTKELIKSVDTFSYLMNVEKRQHPSFEPIKQVSHSTRGTGSEMSNEEMKYIKEQQSHGWTFNKTMKFISSIEPNELKVMLGWKDITAMRLNGTMQAEEVRAQMSNNAKIERELEYASQYYSEFGHDNQMYMAWDKHGSDRYMMDGNFNPDESKIHRMLANKEDMIAELDVSNKDDMALFELALAQAFDLGIDKMSDTTALNELHNIVSIEPNKVTFGKDGAKHEQVVNAIIANKITSEVKSIMTELINEGEGAHTLQALVELAGLVKAIRNSEPTYKSELTIEADAITSGMILTLLQIGSDKSLQLLAKGGVYTNEVMKAYTALLEYTNMKGQKISHGVLNEAKFTSVVPKEMRKHMITVGLEDTSIGSKVLNDFYTHFGVKANDEIEIIRKSYPDMIKELELKGDKDSMYEAKKLQRGLDVINFVMDVEGKEKDIITRKVAKDPTMTTIYGSSINTVKRNLGFTVVKSSMIKLMKKNGNKTLSQLNQKEHGRFVGILSGLGKSFVYETINESTGEVERVDVNKNPELATLNNMKFTGEMNKNVSMSAWNTFGQAFEVAFKDIDEIKEYRETVKFISETSFQVFKSVLDSKLKEYAEANGTTVISKDNFKKIMNDMENNGFGYYVKNIYGSLQYLYKTERVANSLATNVRIQKIGAKSDKTRWSIQNDTDVMVSNNSAAPVITIHSIDGFINSRIKEKVLNIKDANLMGLNRKVIQNIHNTYNESSIDSARNQSVLSKMITQLNIMVSNISMKDLMNIKLTQEQVDVFMNSSGMNNQDAQYVIDTSSKVISRIKSDRARNLSKVFTVQHMYISDQFTPSKISRSKPSNIYKPLAKTQKLMNSILQPKATVVSDEAKRSVASELVKEQKVQKQEPKIEMSEVEKKYNEDEYNERVRLGSSDEVIGGSKDTKHGDEYVVSMVNNFGDVINTLIDQEYGEETNPYTENMKSLSNTYKSILESFGLDKEVTIQKWLTTFNSRGSADIMKNSIDWAINLNGDKIHTNVEILMHEVTHIMTEHAIRANPNLRSEIRAVQEAVEKQTNKDGKGFELFISHIPEVNRTSEDIAIAKRIYNYAVLGNESEFLAYAMTNQSFFEAIQEIKVNKNLFGNIDSDSTIAKIMNAIIKTLNNAYSTIRMSGNKVSNIMPSLVHNLTMAQARAEAMSMVDDDSVSSKVKEKFDVINSKLENINNALIEKMQKFFKTNSINLSHIDSLKKISEINGIRQLKESRFFQDIIYNLVKKTNDADVAEFYQMYRQIKKVQESDKEKLKYNISVVLKEYLKELNESERKASKRLLIDIDAHSLISNGYTMEQISELMTDDKKLKAEIKSRQDNIKKLAIHGLYGAYIKQSDNLGYYMVNKQDRITNAMKNAHNIVNAYFDHRVSKLRDGMKNKEQLMIEIDILASLSGIKYSGSENKSITSIAISKSSHGLEKSIKTIGNAMDIYDKELFEKQRGITNVDYRVKGYSYQQSMEDKSMFMVTESELKWYKKLPWMKVVKDVSDLTFKKGGEKKYLIVANNIDVGRTKGAMDIIGFKRSGIDVREIMFSDGMDEVLVQDMVDKLKDSYASKVYSTYDMNKDNVELSPILDLSGNIVNYKYDMAYEDKIAYLAVNDDIIDVIAGTLTNTHAKTSAIGENMKVVDWVVNDADVNYKANPNAYTIIEPSRRGFKSKTDEMWKIIPEYTRNYIMKKTNDNKLIVRTDMLNDVIGYKDFSIGEIEWLKKNHPVMSRYILELETIWKDMVGKYKRIVVTLMGEVVFSNMFSNMMMAIQHGINPSKFLKKIKEGWDILDAYEKDSNEVVQLKVRKVSGEKSLEPKIKALEEKLKRNPMHRFVQDGLFSPIVEDINAGSYRKSNSIDRIIDKVANRMPSRIKDVMDMLYVNENTSLYGTLLKVVQYSDIVSRYAVYDMNIQNGMTEQESLNYLDQLFVNYNYNENRYLKYLNDVGAVMFTKYFFRTPKALLHMASKYPTFTYGTQFLQTVTGVNVIDAADNYYNPVMSFFARFQNPVDMVQEVVDPNILGIFSFPSLIK